MPVDSSTSHSNSNDKYDNYTEPMLVDSKAFVKKNTDNKGLDSCLAEISFERENSIKRIKKFGILAFVLPFLVAIMAVILFAVVSLVAVFVFFNGEADKWFLSLAYLAVEFKFTTTFLTILLGVGGFVLYAVPLYLCFKEIYIISGDQKIFSHAKMHLVTLIALLVLIYCGVFIINSTYFLQSEKIGSFLNLFNYILVSTSILAAFFAYKIFIKLSFLSEIKIFKLSAVVVMISTVISGVFTLILYGLPTLIRIISLVYVVCVIIGFIQLKSIKQRKKTA